MLCVLVLLILKTNKNFDDTSSTCLHSKVNDKYTFKAGLLSQVLTLPNLIKYKFFPYNGRFFSKHIRHLVTVYHIYVAIIKLVFVHTFPVLIYDTSLVLYVQQIAFIWSQSEYHDSANMQKCINKITNQQQFPLFAVYLIYEHLFNHHY